LPTAGDHQPRWVQRLPTDPEASHVRTHSPVSAGFERR
jgi:hypothetical protein